MYNLYFIIQDGDIIVLPEEYNESFFDEGEAAAAAAIQNPPKSDKKTDPIESPKWYNQCYRIVSTQSLSAYG